ncbi:MAG: ribosomal-protein-alanine N-acetyltransferase [Gammaproteobacteria bacterium]|nr:MAG: ribosomal-protein-alanine N-acetyltransferase [Gammaproteobacteria bacterium]RTZ73661.1 MAG: ribosomal-protein-alanine N-acetyltransferase [Gammaproteobacteria bacterium]
MSEPASSLPFLQARPMREADLDAVLRIEEDAYPYPWSRGIFADCLKVGYQCRVYEKEGEIVGYSVHSTAAGEGHLLNLCVAPQHQSQGHGRRMLRKVMAEMREQGADTLFLEVRLSNKAAQALYESEGFNEVGRRFDYYPAAGGREDALVYACALAGST